MTMNKTITIHTAAYERSHGRKPFTGARGIGCWLFQQTRNPNCFDADLHGDVVVVQSSTLREAINNLRNRGLSGDYAVLP